MAADDTLLQTTGGDDVRTGVVGRNSVKQQSVDGVDNRCDDEQVVRERVAALRERRRGERVERQPLVARCGLRVTRSHSGE